MALPTKIEVRGAKVHNLKNIDVDIPLHKFVATSMLYLLICVVELNRAHKQT